MLAVRRLVQQLGQVCEVGHVPLTAAAGQDAPPHPGQLCGLEDGRHPTLTGVIGPLPQPVRDLVGQRITMQCQILRGLAKEHRGGCRAHQPGPVWLVERLQQAQPVVGGLGGKHIGIPGVHRRDTGCTQRVVAGSGVLVGLDDHRDIARLQRFLVERRPAGQQRADVGGQIPADVPA